MTNPIEERPDLAARIASLIISYQEEAGDQECSADEYYASILELSKRIVFVICTEIAKEVQLIGCGDAPPPLSPR